MSTNQLMQSQEGNFLLNQQSLESAYRLATAFYKANCFNETVKNAEQALAILIAGHEAGLKPAESMSSFYFVKSKLQMWGSGLAKSITRAGVQIKYTNLSKSEIDVSYLRDGELIQRLQYKAADLPLNSQAKKFAPEEKLVYHAHSRFLRYNDVGVSVPYTDYDQTVIEASATPVEESKPNQNDLKEELTKFIVEEVQNKESLMQIASEVNKINDPELTEAFKFKLRHFEEMEEPETSDGALLEETVQSTKV